MSEGAYAYRQLQLQPLQWTLTLELEEALDFLSCIVPELGGNDGRMKFIADAQLDKRLHNFVYFNNNVILIQHNDSHRHGVHHIALNRLNNIKYLIAAYGMHQVEGCEKHPYRYKRHITLQLIDHEDIPYKIQNREKKQHEHAGHRGFY
ncbi:hypothetical protein D3C78_953510 [compost metagenome]